MASSRSRSNEVYHEKEVIIQSGIMLQADKTYGELHVSCNKALGNCLLQKHVFTDNIKITLKSDQIADSFKQLWLSKYFNIWDIYKPKFYLDKTKAPLLSSILALNQALLCFNIFLSPVDDMIYTSMVENPQGFICLLDNAWVVIRIIKRKWYLLDPRASSAKGLSDTHLELVIKQLLLNEEPVFRVSGYGFTAIKSVKPKNSSDPVIKGRTSVANFNNRPSTTRSDMYPEPKPPNLMSIYMNSHQYATNLHRNGDNVLQGVMVISRVEKNLYDSNQSTKKDTHTRSRSEGRTRPRVQKPDGQRSDQNNQLQTVGKSFDSEWPSLQQVRNKSTQRRRARSTPRPFDQSREQLYRPPNVTAENVGGKKDVKRKALPQRAVPSSSKRPEDHSSCCICLDSFPDHVLYPCGHQCLCGQCKKSFVSTFKKCPICNKKVADVIKIYKA